MTKVVVKEKTEITKQINVQTYAYVKGIWSFHKYSIAHTTAMIQIIVTVKRARFKVTTSLYFSPSNSARSLSKLIAVDVNKDTPLKIYKITSSI